MYVCVQIPVVLYRFGEGDGEGAKVHINAKGFGQRLPGILDELAHWHSGGAEDGSDIL
jgi:hypothetical protein